MQVNYYKEWSEYLNRDMEYKVYGHAGRPMMVFPCQSGRFWDWEDQGMVEIAKPWIEAGKLQLFCVDSIDPESWDCPNGDPHARMEMHEKWFNYLTEEFYPRMIELNGGENYGKVITTGSSMGGNMEVWVQLTANQDLLESQYEVLSGKMPTKWNEVVLVVSEDNRITDFTLYSLGSSPPTKVVPWSYTVTKLNLISFHSVYVAFCKEEFTLIHIFWHICCAQ